MKLEHKVKPLTTKNFNDYYGEIGIMFLWVTLPNCWHLSQILQKLKESLNKVSQQKLYYKIFTIAFLAKKWPP